MKRIQSQWFFIGINVATISILFIFLDHTQSSQKTMDLPNTIESFLGVVCFVDYGSAGLDFVVLTLQRPKQDFLLDNIQTQCFESIWVSREMEADQPIHLKKIKDSLLEALETRKHILVYGNYTRETVYTLGRADAYLRLTSFKIYTSRGYPHVQNSYVFEGVVGGVFGCMAVPIKK